MLRLVAILWLLVAPILSEISSEEQLPNVQNENVEPMGDEAENLIGGNIEINSIPLNEGKRDYRAAYFHRFLKADSPTVSTVPKSYENTSEFCTSAFEFFPDPNGNCSVYYVCHGGYAEKRTCDGRLHFNPITLMCDYPSDAVCSLKCPEEKIRLHVPGKCNMYVECNAGVGKYVKCPEGLHFNAVIKFCDHPANAACNITCPDYNTDVALPGRCNMYVRCEDGLATLQLCRRGLHFNPFTLQCQISKEEECYQKCLKPDGYFPVLGQCNSYVRCRNNHPQVFTCPSGLHFNFYLQTCDVPKEDGCEFKCKKLYGFFPFPGVCSYYFKCLNGIAYLQRCKGEMEFNPNVNQCDYTVKDSCLPYCPESNGVFPIEKHCDHYIRCVNGRGLVKRCPAGLHFNAIFEYCDLPDRAKCMPKCPQPTGLFALPGRCNEYFICENSTTYNRNCGRGLHFNARTQTCEWPALANCKISCPQDNGYFPVQGDCSVFMKCNHGHATRRRCPDGKQFNVHTTRCELTEQIDCAPPCTIDGALDAFPGYCDTYLLCTNKNSYIDTCSTGLLFNRRTNTCDIPAKVNCSA